MDGLLNLMVNYKVADICILSIGLYSIVLIAERFKALYFDYSVDVKVFMAQVTKLINENHIDQAITFCSANQSKPLAYVLKRVLERSDRDERAISQSLDIASSEIAPKLVKRLSQLQMVSNVVTLIGLFGTVVGLIVAFKALSFADVTQKQTILAQGISIAMTATAAALLVAIPTMFAYTFLHDRQSRLFAEIDEHSQKIIELLNDRIYAPFKTDSVYPNITSTKLATPTPPGTKSPKAAS